MLVGLLLLANTFLSYGSFSSSFLGWVFAMGFLLPVLFLFGADPTFGPVEKNEVDGTLVRNPWRWLVFFIFLGAIPRIWRITETFLWPTGDEGLHGFLALELAKRWTGQFFYTVGEHPPLLIWCLAGLYKIGSEGFTALWSLPAFFSLLLVPVGYGAARHWFDRKWSLLLAFLMAFSYWPLSLGRYCHQGLFVPFWELSAFWGMGKLFQNSGSRWGGVKAFLLGLWIGWGTLTFTAWWAVLFGFTVAFVWLFRAGKKQEWIGYWTGLSLGVAPFLFATVRDGYGHHLMDSSFLSGSFDQNHIWITRFSYITSIFWGSLQPGTSYGPLWGGMLNPFLTTAFWIGLAALFHRRSEGWAMAILFALFISLLPGILAGDYVELNRIIQAMPWILMTSLVGIRSFLSWVPWSKASRAWVLWILVLSFILDGLHYLQPILPGEKARFGKSEEAFTGSDENFRAYQILKKMFDKEGRGIIFTDFMPLKFGHTLYVAAHSFNAAEDKPIDPRTCHWAALVTEVQYLSFLRARFPQAQWSWFGTGKPTLEGQMALGILSLGDQDQKWITDWLSLHHSFHRLNLEAEQSFNGPQYFQTALKDTWDLYPRIRGDRYMESVYWEWVSQFNFGPDPQARSLILLNAVEKGYPAAHLLEQLAQMSARAGFQKEAAKLHGKALQALRQIEGTLP